MGERAIDLTGQRFGKLLVLERAPNKYSSSGTPIVMWKCLCDCQKNKSEPDYTYKRSDALRRGIGWSCGCDVKEKRSKALTKDLVGQKFGRLTVIEYAGIKMWGKKSPTSNTLWKCLCDCQLNKPEKQWEYSYATTNGLTTGNTQSCGCYGKEKLIEMLHARKTPNKYEKENEYYIGYTNKGERFYIDAQDYDLVSEYKWFINADGYVVAHLQDGTYVFMHRLIMGLVPGDNLIVDHICGEQTTADNRRYNLRIVTCAENQMNRKRQSNNTSGVVGVWYENKSKKWVAEIQAYGNKYRLGRYKTLEEAKEVRKEAENILHGDYSYQNSQLYGNKKLQALVNIQKEQSS